MKTKKNTRKIWAAVFIVALFLISSMVPVNAARLTYIAEQKTIPALNNVHTSAAKKYAVIMVGMYSGPTILSYIFDIPGFLKQANQSYVWFLNAAGMMYNTLHDTYGYDENNIFLLVHLLPVIPYQGKTYFNTIPPTFNTNWKRYESSKENLESILKTFEPPGSNALNNQDQLFICFIDHGGNEGVNFASNDQYINEFISPNSHIDTNWVDEYKAFDDYYYPHACYHDTGTNAVFNQSSDWSDWLTLTLNAPTKIKGFRINAKKENNLDQMNVILYNGNTIVYASTFTDWPNNGYKYVEFEGVNKEKIVDKVKIRFHENAPYAGFLIHQAKVYDFNFWTAEWDNCGEVGDRTYFGCPFMTIPSYLGYLWSILWGGSGSSMEKLYDFELWSYTNEIQAKIIFALQPCMSGGFISELSGPNRIVCTASRGCELAEASWVEPFTRALNKIDENNDGIPDADYNNDGQISILEAYRYAAEKVKNQLNAHPDFPPQHPLIDDNGDHIGHHFSETNYYDPNDPTKDGYLAAHTFLGKQEISSQMEKLE